MKRILLVTLAILAVNSHAFMPEQVMEVLCEDVIQLHHSGRSSKKNAFLHNNNEGLHYYITSKWEDKKKKYLLLNPEKQVDLSPTITNVHDFIALKDRLWLLNDNTLVETDLEGRILSTYNDSRFINTKLKSLAYDEERQLLYIAASSLGLYSFDINTKTFKQINSLKSVNSDGHRSQAVSVMKKENTLILVLAGTTSRGFHGFVLFDIKTAKVTHQAGYDRRSAGILSSTPFITLKDNVIYLNNGGWMHFYRLEDIKNNESLKLSWQPITDYSLGRKRHVQLIGDPIITNQVLACGAYRVASQRHHGEEVRTRAFFIPLWL